MKWIVTTGYGAELIRVLLEEHRDKAKAKLGTGKEVPLRRDILERAEEILRDVVEAKEV